jgi:hypothetical protein
MTLVDISFHRRSIRLRDFDYSSRRIFRDHSDKGAQMYIWKDY